MSDRRAAKLRHRDGDVLEASRTGDAMLFFVMAVLLAGVPSFALGQDAGLSTPELRKAAFGCQKVVTQVTAKVATARFEALDHCSNAALKCVQITSPIGPCLDGAAISCLRTLARSAGAIVKARTKISKSCAGLRTADLLGSDGPATGSGATAGRVATHTSFPITRT